MSGEITNVTMDDPEVPGWQYQNMVMIYDPSRGYMIDLVHLNYFTPDGEPISSLIGTYVTAGTQLTTVGPKDYLSTEEHIHMEVCIPTGGVRLYSLRRNCERFNFLNYFFWKRK